jgi:hypothetical protein
MPDYYDRFHFAHTLVKYYKTHVLSDTELVRRMHFVSRSESLQPQSPLAPASKSHCFKRKRPSRSDTPLSNTPLTDGERRFLDQNIARGGGIVLKEEVQNKSAWVKEAKDRKLCIRCSGPGHFADDCEATKQSNSGASTSKSSLNAIFPGTAHLNERTQS